MLSLFADLEARGIVKQITSPQLSQRLAAQPITLYAGFDPTSDALHVGSLLPLLTLRRFQMAGHRPIAVVGGATGMIGDPSGKSQERNLLTDEQIQKNVEGIRSVISKFLDMTGPNAATIVNNSDWFRTLSFIHFLRDIGKHFTVNHMVAKESVRARLEDREHGISYTEFSYMLLQAYDFHHLHETQKCELQIGGSDQWGNITAGIELIRRIRVAKDPEAAQAAGLDADHAPEVFGLTHPLVSKADGTKFGKTESGTIWLDPKKTSPYRFYQFFIQTSDADVMTYLKFFTFLSHDQLREIEASLQISPEKRTAQTILAQELTRLVHGEVELKKAEKATHALFGESIRELDETTLMDVLSGAPSTLKSMSSLADTSALALLDLLVETQLCPSKGQARKDVQAGGIYLNNERVTDAILNIQPLHLLADRYVVLRKGKKNYHWVKFQ